MGRGIAQLRTVWRWEPTYRIPRAKENHFTMTKPATATCMYQCGYENFSNGVYWSSRGLLILGEPKPKISGFPSEERSPDHRTPFLDAMPVSIFLI